MDTPPLEPSPAQVPGANKHPRDKALEGLVISDRYRVDALIAKGGMGAVYSGYHRYLKKRVAVKVLQPDMDRLPELVLRFEREAIAGAHVEHPNVAAATDFGKLDDGSFFLVVEYARGITLSELLRRERVTPIRAARIARQLASALDAVHALGIVHRDVKSRNVIVATDEGDLVKLIDFGLARVPLDRFALLNPRRSRLDSVPQRITAVGEIFGTVAYLAPEAAFGMDEVDARSDLYALGVVFYEMLAGRRPYVAIDPGDLFLEQQGGPPRIRARTPGAVVPTELEDIVMRLLAHDPAERFQRGGDVAAAIDCAIASLEAPPSSGTTTALTQTAEAPIELPLRSIGIPAAAILALALATVAAVAHLVRTPHDPAPAAVAAFSPAPIDPAIAEAAQSAAPLADPGFRRALARAARARDTRAAKRALLALLDHDAPSLVDPEIAAAARDVAIASPADGSGDDVLEALARAGSPGLDVLYGIVERRGGSRVASRAAAILRRADVITKASPNLALALALRDSPCVDKLALLDRAAREGDARVLITLETQGRACYGRNAALEAAIVAIRLRLTPR